MIEAKEQLNTLDTAAGDGDCGSTLASGALSKNGTLLWYKHISLNSNYNAIPIQYIQKIFNPCSWFPPFFLSNLINIALILSGVTPPLFFFFFFFFFLMCLLYYSPLALHNSLVGLKFLTIHCGVSISWIVFIKRKSGRIRALSWFLTITYQSHNNN